MKLFKKEDITNSTIVIKWVDGDEKNYKDYIRELRDNLGWGQWKVDDNPRISTHDEIIYLIRSIQKNMPWIKKIILFTARDVEPIKNENGNYVTESGMIISEEDLKNEKEHSPFLGWQQLPEKIDIDKLNVGDCKLILVTHRDACRNAKNILGKEKGKLIWDLFFGERKATGSRATGVRPLNSFTIDVLVPLIPGLWKDSEVAIQFDDDHMVMHPISEETFFNPNNGFINAYNNNLVSGGRLDDPEDMGNGVWNQSVFYTVRAFNRRYGLTKNFYLHHAPSVITKWGMNMILESFWNDIYNETLQTNFSKRSGKQIQMCWIHPLLLDAEYITPAYDTELCPIDNRPGINIQPCNENNFTILCNIQTKWENNFLVRTLNRMKLYSPTFGCINDGGSTPEHVEIVKKWYETVFPNKSIYEI